MASHFHFQKEYTTCLDALKTSLLPAKLSKLFMWYSFLYRMDVTLVALIHFGEK